MIKLRLRAIQFVSFRYSDLSTWDAFKSHRDFPGDLRRGEVYLFISRIGDQLLFVCGEHQIKGRRVLDSRKLRMVGRHAWDLTTIGDAAKKVGIELVGMRTLEERLCDRRDEIREAARERAHGGNVLPIRPAA